MILVTSKKSCKKTIDAAILEVINQYSELQEGILFLEAKIQPEQKKVKGLSELAIRHYPVRQQSYAIVNRKLLETDLSQHV